MFRLWYYLHSRLTSTKVEPMQEDVAHKPNLLEVTYE